MPSLRPALSGRSLIAPTSALVITAVVGASFAFADSSASANPAHHARSGAHHAHASRHVSKARHVSKKGRRASKRQHVATKAKTGSSVPVKSPIAPPTTAPATPPVPVSLPTVPVAPVVPVVPVVPTPLSVPYKPITGVFGPLSPWKLDVSAAPMADNSAGLVANLANQVAVRYGGIASFNWYQYNVVTYTVSPLVPSVDLKWDNCQHKNYVPGQLYDPARGAIFKGVPIPDDAQPSSGSDGELSIYSPATDQLWEFWKANKQADGWHACWGGRIDHASTSNGYFSDGTGASATGLAETGGSIGTQEVQSGSINHAMSLAIYDVAHWSLVSYPAQRSDGSQPVGTVDAIEEGQRFRLDPSIDVDSLHLTPLATMVARAAQKYGFIVTNKAGAVSLSAEDGSGIARSTGTNPWTAILAGKHGYDVLKNFPWSKLQALPVSYGK